MFSEKSGPQGLELSKWIYIFQIYLLIRPYVIITDCNSVVLIYLAILVTTITGKAVTELTALCLEQDLTDM